MVFSSHLFLFYFLPAALLLYYLVPRRAKHGMLTLVSYAFYGWANPLFMVLMFASTLVDYIAGLAIACNGFHWRAPERPLEAGGHRSRLQRGALAVSICSNLSLLGFFKYFNFAVENIDALAQWLGWPGLGIVLRVTLPLGISFYTFQSMSYTIDVYRGQAKALFNFTDFACYVSMFPQLVAGPIIRFSEVADQLHAALFCQLPPRQVRRSAAHGNAARPPVGRAVVSALSGSGHQGGGRGVLQYSASQFERGGNR